MERNIIKMCSDPYRKHIDYFWREEDGKWKDMSKMDESPLNKERFISSPISHIAYEVLSILDKKYNSTAGIEIIFEGTDDDYADLSFIMKAYYAENNIELARGARKMKSAKEVMPQIEASFGELKEYFEKYPDKETEEVLAKYQETVKPEIALCVMGLYSSGKSAFINSLIGQEILPSASDPATAKVYKIRTSEKCKVAFTFQSENYVIEFDGKGWRVNKNPNSEIMQSIKSMIDDKRPKSTEQFMHWTLFALNDYAKKEGKERHEELLKCYTRLFDTVESEDDDEEDDEKIEKLLRKYRVKELTKAGHLTKNKLDDVIEVSVNFRHPYLPLEKFEFVIYDTPGSNSVMFREHMDILKESLEQQTNGLPIFVTNPDSMDCEDNRKIIKIINKMGGALDVSNMMLVVNRSDEKAKSDLRKISENKDSLAVTKRWKSSRVYFVSSIMGLGGKKEKPKDKDEWIDECYAENFYKNIKGFSEPDCEQYKRLFEYNILPEDSKKRLEKRTEKIADTQLLIWNSGIPCVEEEIGIFAQKDALYNKCAQAIKYLDEVVERVEEDIEKAKARAKEIRSKIEKQLDEQKKKLMEELKGICEEKKKKSVERFAETIVHASVGKYLEEGRIKERVKSAYDNSCGKNDYERLESFNNSIENCLRKDMKEYSDEKSKMVEEYWRECAEELRESLMQKVADSPVLSKEQKELLKEILLKVLMVPNKHKILNIANTSAIVNKGKKFLWINRTHINLKKAQEEYKGALRFDLEESNRFVTVENESLFCDWISQILNKLEAKLSVFNPGLIDLSRKLKEQQGIIETKQSHEAFIKSEILEIDRLLEFEEAQE